MKRKWVLITIATLLAFGAGVFYWYQTRPTHTERFYEPTPDQAKITREARKVYATLDMTPVEAFVDLQAAESYFEQVPIQDPQPGTTQIPVTLAGRDR